MKKTLLTRALSVGAALALVIPATATAVNASEVDVPDAGFRHCLNDHVGQPAEAALTEAQLESIEELDCGSSKRDSTYHIENLSGAERLTGATRISLAKNDIADVSALSGLTQLESLSLRLTKVVDVAALSGLTSLEHLDLGFNGITDVSALSGLTNLTELTLSGNPIEDLAPLSDAAHLKTLDLGGGRAVRNGQHAPSLTGLDQLTQLESLSLAVDREMKDISSVAGLSNLRTLDLSESAVTDLSPLAGLTDLEVLKATSSAIDDLSPLAGLKNLEALDVSGNSVEDVSPVAGLSNLQKLVLQVNKITDASALKPLAEREDVDLSLSGQSWSVTTRVGEPVVVPPLFDAFGTSVALTTCEPSVHVDGCMEYVSATGEGTTFTPEAAANYTLGFEGTGEDDYSVRFHVEAKEAPTSDGPAFTDNPGGSRFHDPIQWMADEGISVGYGDGTFKKDKNVSRGETAQFLYRMTGQSVTATEPPFTDVRTSFKDAVAWLAQTEISVGYANGQFRPNRPVTRGEFAAFLYRMERPEYFQAPGRNPFTDISVGGAHRKAISWLADTGITAGYTDGTFKAGKTISRAEVAAFLYRYDNLGQ